VAVCVAMLCNVCCGVLHHNVKRYGYTDPEDDVEIYMIGHLYGMR